MSEKQSLYSEPLKSPYLWDASKFASLGAAFGLASYALYNASRADGTSSVTLHNAGLFAHVGAMVNGGLCLASLARCGAQTFLD